jgi:hypothetical protein
VVLDNAPAWLARLAFRMILRCTQHTMASGFGYLGQAQGGRGSKFLAEFVPCGLSHVRRPGKRIPGQPGPELFFPTLGRGDRVFHQAMVGRGMVQDEEGV